MRRDFRLQKRIILGALGVLLAADAALAAYRWRMAARQTAPQQELERRKRNLELFGADIRHAQEISGKMPAIQQDCDRFEKSFPLPGSGYSTIVSELGETARKAGLRVASLAFHEKDVAGRPLREITIDAALDGNYQGVVHFSTALQKSESFYIVDELKISMANQGGAGALHVDLKLRTFFRASS